MRRVLKIFAAMLIVSLVSATYSYAVTIDKYGIENYDDNIFILSGTKGNEKNESVAIQILRPNAVIDDVYNGKNSIMTDFVLYTQVLTDENGVYSAKVKMYEADGVTKVPTGDYTVRVDGGAANGGAEAVYTYAPVEWKAEFIRTNIIDVCKNNSEATAKLELAKPEVLGGISGEITDVVKQLGITDSLVFEVEDDDKLFGILYELINSADIASSDADKVGQILGFISDAAKIQALNEGKVSVVAKQGEKYIFGLDEKYTEVFDEKLSDETKAEFDSVYFVGKDYGSYEKIGAVFKDAVLLWMSKNFGSWGDARDFLTDFGEDVGIDMDSFDKLSSRQKSTLYSYVATLGFDDIESFKTLVNKKIISLKNESAGASGGSSGGSGGSGGSSGGTGASGSVNTPPIMTIEPETLKNEGPGNASEKSNTFNDIEDFEWASEAINVLAEKQVINGTGDGKFEPARNVLREEIIKMLLVAFNVEIVSEADSFNDVKENGWYKDYIATAKAKGYVSGRPDGSFGVGAEVTREDVSVMAYNIAKSTGMSFDLTIGEIFSDDASVSDYAKEAVYALKNSKVISGKGENTFEPKAPCTRAEAAKIIYSLLNN